MKVSMRLSCTRVVPEYNGRRDSREHKGYFTPLMTKDVT